MDTTSTQFAVVAIPLNRPDIVDFLLPPTRKPRGARVRIVGQRPSASAEAGWIRQLRDIDKPAVTDFLDIDHPRHTLRKTTTDRLFPIEFLAQPEVLTRNLGGWNAIYFGVMQLPGNHDPLLAHLEILSNYGPQIRFFGADPAQVAARLETEAACEWPTFLSSLLYLHSQRPRLASKDDVLSVTTTYIQKLFRETLSGNRLATPNTPPVPKILLYDELLSQMRQLELARRRYLMAGKTWHALTIQTWQEAWQQESGMQMIVKGEYIAGRHRGSLVLIAPELGVVIKQPAPEPFHEVTLNAVTYAGKPENWPVTTRDGALVTSRGRVRLLLEEGYIPQLHEIFDHKMSPCTSMGFTLEEFVVGKTIQEYVLADHSRMTPELYNTFILYQQTCEAVGVENGDWHSANFIRRDSDNEIVHIDWGAARPLEKAEYTPEAISARLNQVQNIAYSFHNEELANRTLKLHQALLADSERLDSLRQRAKNLVGQRQ